MKSAKKLLAIGALMTMAGTIPAVAQNAIVEQTRIGGGTQANNPDFVFAGFASGTTSDHTTVAGVVSGYSTASRYSASSIPGGAGTNVIIYPNGLTAGSGHGTVSNTETAGTLSIGTTYLVSVAYAGTPTASSTDIVVTNTDSGMSGIDSFASITSTCFQAANGYNKWIPVGYITPGTANPSITFSYFSGVNGRWNVDSILFSPIAPPPSGTYQYWNTGSPGGTGSWDATTPNWNTTITGSGTQGPYTQADLADFAGTAGTVTIDPINGITTDGGLEFDVNGYTVTGGTLTLGSSPSTVGTNIAVAPGSTVTINSVIAGSYGLCNAYLGTVNLGAVNTLTGTVTLLAGKLHLNANANQTFSSLTGSGNLALGANTLTVGTDNSSTTYAGVLSDGGSVTPGALIKAGTGTLTLSGVNSYDGPTTINSGTLSIASDSNLGGDPSSLVANQLTLNGGRLDFTAVATINANRGITIGANGGIVSTPGSGTTVTISSPITGSGNLTNSTGSFDLKGNNSGFSGNIYLIGTPLDTGGNNLSAIRFDHAGASGTGQIFVSPTTTANITLRNFNTAGTVTVPNAMELDPAPSLSSPNIFLAGGSAASVFAISFTGNINGAAPVNIGLDTAGGSSNPGGEVDISGSNTLWTGGATLQCGKLGLGSSNAMGTGGLFLVPAGPAEVLYATTPLVGANAVTNSIGINATGVYPATNGLTIGGANSLELSGPVILYGSSTINMSNTATSVGTIFSGSISDNANNFGLTFSDVTGTSVFTLSGSNNYTGGTTINSGTVNGAASNSIPGTVVSVNGGTLELSSPGAMSSTATLNVNNSGTVNLNFTGYQAVAALNINGSPAGYGIYSAATYPGGTFTGTGNLVVAPAFVITTQSIDSSTKNLNVCWESVTGVNYDIMTNSSLTTTNWYPATASPITASGTTTCYTIPGTAGLSNIFVAVRADYAP